MAAIETVKGIHIFTANGDQVRGHNGTIIQGGRGGTLLEGKSTRYAEEVEQVDVHIAAGFDDFAFSSVHFERDGLATCSDKDIQGLGGVVDHNFKCGCWWNHFGKSILHHV